MIYMAKSDIWKKLVLSQEEIVCEKVPQTPEEEAKEREKAQKVHDDFFDSCILKKRSGTKLKNK